MSQHRIRVGFVGAGANAANSHIPRFRAIEGVEILGVVNSTRHSSERAAREHGIPRVYDEWTQLLDDPDIDAVVIGTWPYMHHPVTLQALEKGKHVFTEARMAMSADEAREMLAASRSKPNLVAQVNPGSMASPAVVQTLIELVGGSIGEVLAVDFTQASGFADLEPVYPWRHDRDLSGFNIMMVAARYEDMLRIFGPATSVTAITRLFYPRLNSPSGGPMVTDIPDHVEITAELSGRATMHMRLSTVTGFAPASELWVFGSEGTVRCVLSPPGTPESSGVWLGCRGDDAMSEVVIPREKWRPMQAVADFVGAIRGECPVGETTFEDGLKYMEFTEAVTRSAQERRTIPLPL